MRLVRTESIFIPTTRNYHRAPGQPSLPIPPMHPLPSGFFERLEAGVEITQLIPNSDLSVSQITYRLKP